MLCKLVCINEVRREMRFGETCLFPKNTTNTVLYRRRERFLRPCYLALDRIHLQTDTEYLRDKHLRICLNIFR